MQSKMHRQTAFIKNDLDAKVYIKATGNRTLVECLKRMHFLEMCIHLCNVYVFRLLLICKEEKSITFEGTNVPVGKSNKYSTSDGLILKL